MKVDMLPTSVVEVKGFRDVIFLFCEEFQPDALRSIVKQLIIDH